MKKTYKKPFAEVVNVKLVGSILQDEPTTPIGKYSNTTQTGDGKENDFDIDEGGFTPDLWGEEEEDY